MLLRDSTEDEEQALLSVNAVISMVHKALVTVQGLEMQSLRPQLQNTYWGSRDAIHKHIKTKQNKTSSSDNNNNNKTKQIQVSWMFYLFYMRFEKSCSLG